MPTYGYRCTVCKHEFERFQKMTDPPVTECETCQAPVKKILYPVGIAFKGDGFYVNDYAPKSAKNADKAADTPATEATAPASGSGGDTAKTEAPAAAPAATTAAAPAVPAGKPASS